MLAATIATGALAQTAMAAPGLWAEFRSIDSASTGAAIDGVYAPDTFKATFAAGADLESKRVAPSGGLALDESAILPTANNWAGLVTGTLTAPAAGRYTLSATLGGAFYLAIDGRPVMQSKNSQPCATVINLEAGPHTIEIGLAKATGTASLSLSALAPGGSAATLIPLAWLSSPDGPETAGIATSPTTLAVADNDVVYAHPGTTIVAGNGADLASLGLDADATAELQGVDSTVTLYGSGAIALGPQIYTKAITSDADTGLDSAKTYTHCISFPMSGASATTPTVNGVTFGSSDSCIVTRMGGNALVDNKASGDFPGYTALCQSSQYQCSDYVVTLTGLTPGALYDFRYYWKSRGENSPRTATFIFYGQDATGNTITNGVASYALESVFGTGADKYGVIGCRYRAGADGKANLRVVSADENRYRTAFLYAVSNELLANGAGDQGTLVLAPAAGERASYFGTIGGGAVEKSGAGEQLFGGAGDSPVTVTSGRLILANGANAAGGVAVGSGATVEMRGGAHIGGLSGAGTLDFKYGDCRLFGAVNANGGLDTIANFRIVHFTDDASSGVSPSKKYHLAFDYQNSDSPDITQPVVVNEVPFRPTAAAGYDPRTVFAYAGGAPAMKGSGNEANIGMPSTEAFYSVFSQMRYPNWRTAPNTSNFKIDSLTSGKTYEARFYERNYASSANRNVDFTFTPSNGAASETHSVSIDTEGSSGPYYVAIRFRATSSSYTITAYSPNGDGWMLFGATVEEVESGTTDRAFLDIATDTDFAGAVTGVGSVQKNGAGTLTLSGDVASDGFWYVSAGGLLLANATASIGEVAVGNRADCLFGGIGNVDGSVGIPGAATFVLGSPGTGGNLNVGGTVALGNGATVIVNGADNALSSCTASAWLLPANLSFKPAAKVADGAAIFTCPTGFDNVDMSGWTVYKPNGSVNTSAHFSLSGDGNEIRLSLGEPFVMVLR